MTFSDGAAGGADVGAGGQLEALAVAPGALAQDGEIENLDAHGGEV